MSSTDNISETILNTSEMSTSTQPLFPSSTDTWFTSFISFFQNINWTTWLIIILILAFLGFNVFAYLAKGTQDVTNIFGPAFKKIFGLTLGVTGDIIDTTAQGAKSVVNASANIIDKSLTEIQNITPNTPNSGLAGTSISNQSEKTMQTNSLNQALNTSTKNDGTYEPHEATSSVNYSGSGKTGWCFIGTDRGFNSCAQVGVNDTCMSGEIFPSKEICINPNLRP